MVAFTPIPSIQEWVYLPKMGYLFPPPLDNKVSRNGTINHFYRCRRWYFGYTNNVYIILKIPGSFELFYLPYHQKSYLMPFLWPKLLLEMYVSFSGPRKALGRWFQSEYKNSMCLAHFCVECILDIINDPIETGKVHSALLDIKVSLEGTFNTFWIIFFHLGSLHNKLQTYPDS